MLNSVKAVSYGVIAIVILGLLNQLILIMALVGYASLSEVYPVLSAWSQLFTYILGGLGYFMVMLSGGFVTAMAARKQAYIKAMMASIIGSSFSLSVSLKDDFFTPIALFFILFGILASTLGCRLQAYWEAGHSQQK